MRCTQRITLNDIVNHPVRRILAGAQYAAFRTGPLSIAAGTSGAFFKTNPRLATPDIQIHFLPFSTDKMGEKLHSFSGFHGVGLSVAARKPWLASHQECRPRSAAGNSDQLSRNRDRSRRQRRRVEDTAKDFAGARPQSLCGRRGRSRRRRFRPMRSCWTTAAARGSTIYHPTSTCRMGSDRARRRRSAASASRHRRPAGGRRLDHARSGVGQYQRGHHHDRRKGVRHDLAGCAVAREGDGRLHSGIGWLYLPAGNQPRFLRGVEGSLSGGNSNPDRHAQERHGAGPDRGNCPAADRGRSRYRCRDRQVRNHGRFRPDQQAVAAWRQGWRVRGRNPQRGPVRANCKPRCIR